MTAIIKYNITLNYDKWLFHLKFNLLWYTVSKRFITSASGQLKPVYDLSIIPYVELWVCLTVYSLCIAGQVKFSLYSLKLSNLLGLDIINSAVK